jgi:hypothetical protein
VTAESDPVAYLMAKGWTPDGQPGASGCQWYDPTQPKAQKVEEVKIGVRKNGNREDPIIQKRITPKAWPLSLADAVQTQKARDAAAARK